MRAPSPAAAWHIARNDLRLLLHDRGTLFWSFVGPFMFITFFGLLFRNTGPQPKTVLYLRNEDTSNVLPGALAVSMHDSDVDLRTQAAPKDAYELVVPAGAADTLAAGRLPRLVLRSPSEDPSPQEQMLKSEILRGLLNAFLGLTPADLRAPLDEAAIRSRIAFEPKIRLAKQEIPVAQPSVGFQRSVPAYLIMFQLMSLLTFGSAILIAERRSGQLRRVLVSPVTPGELVLGKFVSRFSWSWLQVAVLLGVGIGLYHVRFGAHPGALLAVLTAYTVCCTSLGLLFASLFRNPDKAGGMGSLLTMAMAALGGCWWPLEIVPGWMQKIAFALPTGWGFDGLNRVMALDAGLPQVGTHIAVLLGLAAVCLPLAARRIPG
jgi:ABC-2 type transport system permease protein